MDEKHHFTYHLLDCISYMSKVLMKTHSNFQQQIALTRHTQRRPVFFRCCRHKKAFFTAAQWSFLPHWMSILPVSIHLWDKNGHERPLWAVRTLLQNVWSKTKHCSKNHQEGKQRAASIALNINSINALPPQVPFVWIICLHQALQKPPTRCRQKCTYEHWKCDIHIDFSLLVLMTAAIHFLNMIF